AIDLLGIDLAPAHRDQQTTIGGIAHGDAGRAWRLGPRRQQRVGHLGEGSHEVAEVLGDDRIRGILLPRLALRDGGAGEAAGLHGIERDAQAVVVALEVGAVEHVGAGHRLLGIVARRAAPMVMRPARPPWSSTAAFSATMSSVSLTASRTMRRP